MLLNKSEKKRSEFSKEYTIYLCRNHHCYVTTEEREIERIGNVKTGIDEIEPKER